MAQGLRGVSPQPVGGPSGGECYAFGAVCVDVARRLVTRDGHAVALAPKTFELLLILLRSGGRVLTRQELIAALWPDTFVEEANLSFQISTLRKAIGDSPAVPATKTDDDGHWIATVPKVGYRFVGPVASTAVGSSTPADDEILSASPRSWTLTKRSWAVLALLTLVVPAALWHWSRFSFTPVSPPVRVIPLTALDGFQIQPSISPDGQQVAFARLPTEEQPCKNAEIYVTLVGSMQVRRLTNGPGNFAPRWSPDGRQIAFLHNDCGPDGTRLRMMSALGGSERALADFKVGSVGSWSPDGRHIAIVRAPSGPTSDREAGIYLVPTRAGQPRALTSPVTLGHFGHFSPALSPDGRQLAYLACPESLNCYVEVLDLDAMLAPVAPARRLTQTSFNRPRGLAWTPDGRSVIFHNETGWGVFHLWRVDTDGRRPPERLEMAGVGATWPAISHRGDRLAFSRYRFDNDIDVLEPGGIIRTVISSSFPDFQPAISPDGRRVVFCSSRSGDSVELWVAGTDGSEAQQLTYGPGRWQCSPHWSPDGRHIVFDSQETTGLHVWVMDADGGVPRQLTDEPGEQYGPTWSRDGDWVYYVWFDGTTRDVWRKRLAGGSPEQLTRGGASFGMESADGGSLVYSPLAWNSPLLVAPLAGGPARQLVKCGGNGGAFVPHRLGLYYVACPGGGDKVAHRLDLTTGRDEVIGTLARAIEGENASLGLAVSPDGTSIMFTKAVSGSGADLWLIEGFR